MTALVPAESPSAADEATEVDLGTPTAPLEPLEPLEPEAVEPRRRKRGDIQGLRALAVALVVADHMGLPGMGGGFLGVDVFFVISGFLITGLVLHEARSRGRISLSGFWARRARRVLPAATLVLLVTLAATAYWESVETTQQTAKDAIWSAGFLANVHLALQGTDYFANATPSLFQHYWSLAVEEQFYLVWPIVLVVAVRWGVGKWRMLAILATVTLASFAWSLHITPLDPSTAYFNTLARGFEFGGGACLAVLAPRFPRWVQWILGFLGAALLTYAVITFSSASPFPGWQAGVPMVATMALLAAPQGPISQILRFAPLRALGTISYSVYLWHWPVLQLAPARLPATWTHTERDLAMIGIVLALSILSWGLLEVPFQRSWIPGMRGRAALVLWPLTFALVVGASFGATSYAQDRLDARNAAAAAWEKAHPEPAAPAALTLQQTIQAAVDQAKDGAPLPPFDPASHQADFWHTDFDCFADNGDSSVPSCTYGDPSATRLVVLLGDSHAGMWLPAIDALGKSEHFRLVPLVKLACAPFFVPQTVDGNAFPTCAAFRLWAVDQIKALHPDAVIVADRGLNETTPRAGQTMEQTWTWGVKRLLTQIVPSAGRVDVLADIPTRTEPLATCATTPGNTQSSCLDPATGSGIRSNPLTEAAAVSTGAHFVDTLDLVCAQGQCPASVEDHWTYFDDDHLTASWVRRVAPDLAKRIGPPFE